MVWLVQEAGCISPVSRALAGNGYVGSSAGLEQGIHYPSRMRKEIDPSEVHRSTAIDPIQQVHDATQKHLKLGRRCELTCNFIGFAANKAKPQGEAEFLVYLV